MDTITLHGWAFSPFVRAVCIALEEAGAAYTLRDLGPGDLAAPEFRALTPFGKIPVLEHGTLRLTETAAILDWIAARHPAAGLMPSSPGDRARALEWMLQAGAYVYPTAVMRLFFQDAYVRANGGTPDAVAVADAAQATAPLLDAMTARIAGPHLLGEAFTAADILVGTMLHNVALTPAGAALLAERQALAAWFARVDARPAFRRTEAAIPLFGVGG
ncbi:glutathione S-transferase family protein [Roseomonas rosulenta]|uniref:glutathione S-transferase family protein n=1 Tax=Roseomonas rosulenta TaxID=2748667 RepID=UPI0018DF1439|nr:glutathione S-transferase family protein [Roseomonas rosulenta]